MLSATIILAALPLLGQADAQPTPEVGKTSGAVIGLIIDDLGNNLRAGQRVISLAGPVACAILPLTPYGNRLAREASAHRKEVILHLPMEAVGKDELGPAALESEMQALPIILTFNEALEAVPRAVGVSNHMGSLLTQEPRAMSWLMRAILNKGNLFFVDSRTTPNSVAAEVAEKFGVPYLTRNVFLDRERNIEEIQKQFATLIDVARRRGSALGIGHPYPETLAFLERRLPELVETDIRVVPLSELLAIRNIQPVDSRALSSR